MTLLGLLIIGIGLAYLCTMWLVITLCMAAKQGDQAMRYRPDAKGYVRPSINIAE